VDMTDLIEERTGARPGEFGAYFRMNPRVDDIPERFSVLHRGIRLMQMGTVRGAGAGCVCPENTMLRALTTHLLLRQKETVIMDMVAGLEHLGRGTAGAVDIMYVVVEPGRRSLDVALDIAALARDLHIPTLWAVGNKLRGERDLALMESQLGESKMRQSCLRLAGWLPYDEQAIEADIDGKAVYDVAPDLTARVRAIAEATGLVVPAT